PPPAPGARCRPESNCASACSLRTFSEPLHARSQAPARQRHIARNTPAVNPSAETVLHWLTIDLGGEGKRQIGPAQGRPLHLHRTAIDTHSAANRLVFLIQLELVHLRLAADAQLRAPASGDLCRHNPKVDVAVTTGTGKL